MGRHVITAGLVAGIAVLAIAGCGDSGSGTPATSVPAPTQPVGGVTQTAPVTVTISSPQDGTVVRSQPVTVRGVAFPGAVVSVNGELATVDAQGNYSAQVALEAGGNVITVTVDDGDGNTATAEVTVGYAP